MYKQLSLKENDYILLTLHRNFNVDDKDKLERILKQLEKNSEGKEDNLSDESANKKVDYLNMMGLVKKCWKVITDSGGLQKEAYFAKKQAIVLMPDTGWRELVEVGWNKLANEENLYEVVMEETDGIYPVGIYGEGNAAKKIVETLLCSLGHLNV